MQLGALHVEWSLMAFSSKLLTSHHHLFPILTMYQLIGGCAWWPTSSTAHRYFIRLVNSRFRYRSYFRRHTSALLLPTWWIGMIKHETPCFIPPPSPKTQDSWGRGQRATTCTLPVTHRSEQHMHITHPHPMLFPSKPRAQECMHARHTLYFSEPTIYNFTLLNWHTWLLHFENNCTHEKKTFKILKQQHFFYLQLMVMIWRKLQIQEEIRLEYMSSYNIYTSMHWVLSTMPFEWHIVHLINMWWHTRHLLTLLRWYFNHPQISSSGP